MGDLIKDWLNNQLEMSTRVANFEKDFSNGYLFGELLFRFSQLTDMSKFQNKNTKEVKIENFMQVLPVMRNLKLKFDSNIAERIINEERGVALRLLYQMKMALEKVAAPSLYKMKDEFVMSMPAQKIRPARDQYDKMTDTFFKKRLQQKIKPQKEVLMERTLKKYDDEKMRQEDNALREKIEMQNREIDAKAQRRKAELNKLQRNAGFMDEWLEKGLKEWRVNILKKKKREKEETQFNLKQTEFVLTKMQTAKKEANNDIYNEITKFENKIFQSPSKTAPEKFEGKDSEDEDFGIEIEEEKKEPFTTTLPKADLGIFKKESRYKQAQYNKEREQRRRKMLMDQGKMQRELEAKRREDDLIDKMKKLSRQEQELEYEAWRTTQCKAVIIENRKLREARYHKREDLDVEVAAIREEEALTTLRGQLDYNSKIESERTEKYTIARKQYKRNQHANQCQQLFDLIFDIAQEAFEHQQISDNQDFDSRNLREWTHLFVEKMPIEANSFKTTALIKTEEKLEKANILLDYNEFLDYIQGKYQWEIRKKPSQPEDEEKVSLINNFELGNAVRTLIEINFPPQEEPDLPRISLDVKLKLSVVGLAFGGKKTQAQLLFKHYGIAVITMDDLVIEALKETKDHNEEGEIPEKKEQEVRKVNEELKAIGLEIDAELLEGHTIPDKIYIKLIMQKLKSLFGFTTCKDYYKNKKEEFVKLSKEQPKPASVIPSEVKKSEPESKDIKIENQEGKEEIPFEKKQVKGFILVDFPTTLSQAKLLEEAMSGYICKEDKQKEIKETLLEEAETIAKPTEIPPPPNALIPSGLDSVIWVKTPREECIKRAFGLKKDVKNDAIYHVVNNPPPTTNYDIVEKLQSLPDDEMLNAILTDRHTAFEMASPALMKWIKQFGDEKRKRCLLQQFEFPQQNPSDNNEGEVGQPPEALFKNIRDLVERILGAKNEDEQQLDNKIKKEVQEEKDTETARLNYERKNMQLEEELARKLFEIEKKKKIEEEMEASKEVKKEEKKGDAKKEDKKGDAKKEDKKGDAKKDDKKAEAKKEEKKVEAKEEQKKEEPVKEEVKEEKKEEPVQVPVKKKPENQIEKEFKPVLLEMWTNSATVYKDSIMKNMRLIRDQREMVQFDINEIQKEMLTFLEQPQDKQKLIDEYIMGYNKFIDDNLDMIEDLETKMEMHQRVEDLSAKFTNMLDELQKNALEKREKVMNSGWAEFQLEKLMIFVQNLMQTEVNRYRSFINFAEDYHSGKEGDALQDVVEESLFAPIADPSNLPLVEDKEAGTFPRLDNLYQSSISILTGEAVSASSGGGGKEAKGKKETKKDAKKDAGKKKKDEEEKEKKPEEQNKEVSTLIENEKKILKYRLVMIKNWAEKGLKEIKENAKHLYEKLSDWIRVTMKCEREAVNQLSLQLRDAIEGERKIQEELRVKGFDLIRDGKFLYFIVPPPKLLPGIEIPREDRFTISQLLSLLKDLKLLVNASGQLDLGLVIALLTKKTKAGKLFGKDEGLPHTWANYSYSMYQQIGNMLDKTRTGFVNYNTLATYISLLQSVLPNAKQLKDYDMKLTIVSQGDNIKREDYAKVDAWFDDSEKSQQREKAELFDRVKMIKEIVWDISKDSEKGLISKKEILKILTAEGLVNNLEEASANGVKYYDILFTNLNIKK